MENFYFYIFIANKKFISIYFACFYLKEFDEFASKIVRFFKKKLNYKNWLKIYIFIGVKSDKYIYLSHYSICLNIGCELVSDLKALIKKMLAALSQ